MGSTLPSARVKHKPSRGAVKQFQPLAERGDGGVAGQRGDLRKDRGDLDRDDLDLRRLQGLQVHLQAMVGLLFTENGLAEEIHVHPQSLGIPTMQVLEQQFRLGGQDDVGCLLRICSLTSGTVTPGA